MTPDEITKVGWELINALRENGGSFSSQQKLIFAANVSSSIHTQNTIKKMAERGLIRIDRVELDGRGTKRITLLLPEVIHNEQQ
jgi:DNA-binding MarR family transcriptional regulator